MNLHKQPPITHKVQMITNAQNSNLKNVLFFSPHPDDHLMCAGTLLKLRKAGFSLFEVLFTDGSKGGNQKISAARLKNYDKACKFLGMQKVFKLGYSNQRYEKPQSWELVFDLEELVKITKEVRPQVLIMPSPDDYHPEHMIVSRIGMKAVRLANIYSDFGGQWRVPLVLYAQGLLPLDNLSILIDTSEFFEQVKQLTLIYEGEMTQRMEQWLMGNSANFGYFLRTKRAEGSAVPKEWPGDISVLLNLSNNNCNNN